MDLQLMRKGLDFSRRKKWILLFAAAGFTGYGCFKVYHLPSIANKRKKFLGFLQTFFYLVDAFSDSAESIRIVIKDLNEFMQSDSDQIPSSLRQIAKIAKSEEFSESVVRVSEAVTVGILRGFNSKDKNDDKNNVGSKFGDQLINKLFSKDGTGFASVVVGSFARNLVMAFYSNKKTKRNSESKTEWMNFICSDKCRDLVGDCMQLFVSTAVTLYLEKTMNSDAYDDFFSGLTNPKHEKKVKEMLISICNGAVETFVKTTHLILSDPNQKRIKDCKEIEKNDRKGIDPDRNRAFGPEILREFKGERRRITVVKENGWANAVSTTLSVPSNRMFLLDVTGRVTFETVRSFLDFMFWKLLSGLKKSIDIIREAAIERGLEVMRFIAAKSLVFVTLCPVFCMHILGTSRFLIPA